MKHFSVILDSDTIESGESMKISKKQKKRIKKRVIRLMGVQAKEERKRGKHRLKKA